MTPCRSWHKRESTHAPAIAREQARPDSPGRATLTRTDGKGSPMKPNHEMLTIAVQEAIAGIESTLDAIEEYSSAPNFDLIQHALDNASKKLHQIAKAVDTGLL